MADTEYSNPPKVTPQSTTPVTADIEGGTDRGGGEGTGNGVSNIVRRWKREDLVKRGSLTSRVLCFLFSFIAFILMASNNHGGYFNFTNFSEYKYVLAIAILSWLYTGVQSFRQIYELYTSKQIIPWKTTAMADFALDQIVAYLLISAASSAVPLSNGMRLNGDNIFTDTSAAAIAMEFFAFFSLALSALISGYKISDRLYI